MIDLVATFLIDSSHHNVIKGQNKKIIVAILYLLFVRGRASDIILCQVHKGQSLIKFGTNNEVILKIISIGLKFEKINLVSSDVK